MAHGEQAKTFAGEIHKSANRLLTLINDIIRLSQMDAPMPDLKFEPVDLAQIATNTFEQLEMSARKVDVTLQLDAKQAVVEADRQMMDELLYNLCDNAIRYNVRGGQREAGSAADSGQGDCLRAGHGYRHFAGEPGACL